MESKYDRYEKFVVSHMVASPLRDRIALNGAWWSCGSSVVQAQT